MKTKVTLTIKESVIKQAKLYAKQAGKSLSEIIETYLQNLTHDIKTEKLSPKLKKIASTIKLPKKFNESKELRSYLENKYL